MFISPFLYRNIGGPTDQSFVSGSINTTLEGVATIYSTSTQNPLLAPTWGSLASVPGTRRNQDEVFIVDIDGAGSSGFARYDLSTSTWKLTRAEFVSQTAMYEFPHPVWEDATVICAENPSRVYRYPSLLGPDSISRGFWLPIEVAEGNPVVAAFLQGDEPDSATRIARGFTDSVTAGGTITGNVDGTGYTRLAITAGGVKNAQLITLTGNVSVNTKVYIRYRCKGVTANSSSYSTTSVHGTYVADGGKISYPRYAGQIGVNKTFSFRVETNNILNIGALRDGGSSLGSNDTWIEFYDDGRTVLSYVYLNGVIYHVAKRSNVNSSTSSVGLITGGLDSPDDAHTDIRNVAIITWT